MSRRVVDSALRGRGSFPRFAGVLCFEQDINIHGGYYIWQTVLAELAQSLLSSRLSVEQLLILNLDSDPDFLQRALETETRPCTVSVLDGYSDPEGWLPSIHAISLPLTQLVSLKSLEGVAECLESRLSARSVVLIDSLSTLIFRHNATAVLQMAMRLRRHPNCLSLMFRFHPGGMLQKEIEAVRSLCTSRLQLTLPKEMLLPLSKMQPHGAVTSYQTTETGRIVSLVEWYRVESSGQVMYLPEPEAKDIDSTRLVEASVKKHGLASHSHPERPETDLMRQMEGGMKLTLTQQEKDAKREVVLPYEQVAELGEIHYLRDSEGEYDSDEDPDDDLDI